MYKRRILMAVLLAALALSIVAMTRHAGATAPSAPENPVAPASGFTITSPTTGSLVPCGQPITVTWTGGSPSDNVNLTLIDVQAFQVYQGFGVEPNTGSRVVTIGPGSCGHTSQFYVEDSPRTTWTYGPDFNVACSNTFNIADGDVAGLIAAINSANASSCPTTINLAPNGTYVLTSVAEGSEWPSGLPIIRTPITINGNGSTIRRSSAPDTPSFIILVVSWTPDDPSKHANLTLDGVTLTGGAGPIGGLALSNSIALVRNSTITNNSGSGDNGGGIHNHCSSLTIYNSTISYNTNESGFGGGGIMHREFDGCSAATSVSFSTIFENRNNGWGRGDAIATRDSGPGSVVVKNSIFASPTRGAGSACWSGPGVLVSDGHNIGGDASCGFNGPGDLNSTNPLLGPTTNNGGPTPTDLPLCNSPAIDAVPLSYCSDVNGEPVTTDQRGVSRPQRTACDIGSVEVATAVTVTIPGNAGPWNQSLNSSFDYGVHDNSPPVVIDASSGIPFLAGSNITVTYVSGTFTGDGGRGYSDANGSTFPTNTYDSSNGRFPGFYMNPGPTVYGGELVGAFAHNGVIVGPPFPIGNGPTNLTIPAGATELMMGMNDNFYSDNSGALNVSISSGSSMALSVTAPNDSSAFADANCQAAIPNYLAGTIASGGNGNVTLSQSPAAGTLVGLGPHTVTVTAMDGCGNSNSDTVVFTVSDHTPPNFTSSPPNITVNTDPGACSAVVTFTLPGATDNCATPTVASSPASGSTFPTGTTNVTVTATDGAGNSTSRTFTVTVADHENPAISCPANISLVDNSAGSCGASFTPTAPAASDNCGIASVIGTRSDGHALTDLYPVGPTTINWVAKDSSGNTASCSQTITVSNPAPSVSITSPASGTLYIVNTAVTFNATFTDNAGDSHTAAWTFDGAPQAGVVNESAHTITANHTFMTAGVYAVTLTIVDDCGQTAVTNQVEGFDAFVVVYDPNAGFVTGGGWIDSPLGAYTPNPLLTGKANFGFVSKYQPGANVPDGQTEFQFKAGNLNFHSTSYDWLVVAGARAQYKGSGTVNGAGNYAFMLTAIDGQINGGGGVDKFRIKIWDKNNGGLIYDNQLNAPDSADPSTALGGGSIVIHK